MLEDDFNLVDDRARKAFDDYARPFENLEELTQSDFIETMPETTKPFGYLGKEMIPAWVEALSHPTSPRKRIVAAFLVCLVRHEKPELVSPTAYRRAADVLVQGIRGQTYDECLLPAILLTTVFVAETTPILKKLLVHEVRRLRVCAAAALSNAIHLDDEDIDIMELHSILRQALDSDDQMCTLVAASALGKLGAGNAVAVSHLVNALKTGNVCAQYAVIQVLARLPSPPSSVAKALSELAAMKNNSPKIREAAAKAFVVVARDENCAIEMFCQALHEDDVDVVVGCMNGFVRRAAFPEAAFSFICQRLVAEHIPARRQAAWWLSIDRQAAAQALNHLLDRLGKEEDADTLDLVLQALAATGRRAVPFLIDIIRQGDMRQVPYANAALVQIGKEAVEDVIRLMLTDPEQRIRVSGLTVLRDIGHLVASGGPILLEMLEYEDDSVKQYVVMTLAAFAPEIEGAIPALVNLLSSKEPEFVYWAKLGLSRLGPAAIPALQMAKETVTLEVHNIIDELLARSARPTKPSFEWVGDDDLLTLFAAVGQVLAQNGATPSRDLEDILEQQKREGKLDPKLPISNRSILKKIEHLGELLSARESKEIRLIEKKPKAAGGLTDIGKTLLPQVIDDLKSRNRRIP